MNASHGMYKRCLFIYYKLNDLDFDPYNQFLPTLFPFQSGVWSVEEDELLAQWQVCRIRYTTLKFILDG